MTDLTEKDNKALLEFWNGAFALSDEEMAEARKSGSCDPKELAPSEKLYNAARMLGSRSRVLDYGCGSAWASIIAAKSGCPDVTAADAAPSAVKAALFYASLFNVEAQIHGRCITADWLGSVPAGTYDGFICSNVLDVVPPETAEEIIRASASAVTPDALVIIGLNYFLSPEAAAEKGIELSEGCRLYRDGVLRLVSRTDEEWAALFAPYYTVEKLEHFAWPGETKETRRLYYLRRRGDK